MKSCSIAARRERKRLRRLNKRRACARRLLTLLDGAILISAPSDFRLESSVDFSRVIDFISSIKSGLKDERRVVLDFRQVRSFSPAATLLLHANIVSLVGAFRSGVLRALMPKRNREHQVLSHLGFCRMFRSRPMRVTRSDVVRWHSVTGDTVDTEHAGTVLEKVLPIKIAGKVYRCVSEAITNAFQHSQIDQAAPVRWSMFVSCSERRMIIALCDLGIGIPVSLPKKTLSEKLDPFLKFFGSSNDSSFINAAIEISRTRTGKEHRGKGLPDIISLVEKVDGATVYVFSNFGCVKVQRTNGITERTPADHKGSLCGTLITWVLPIDVVQPGEGE